MKGIYEPPDMIKAIVEGRKTQTRRLHGLKEINQEPDKWERIENIAEGNYMTFHRPDYPIKMVKPKYHVGEVVFVQEAWAVIKLHDSLEPSEIPAYGRLPRWYKLDDPSPMDTQCNPWPEGNKGKWRSPLFMPEWAARDHRRIKDVRAQRLQEITPEDCIAEGIGRYTFARGCLSENPPDKRWKFIELWDSIHKDYPWDLNPWILRYVFEQVK